MATRFKGLYHKSFKCFSDIFDEKEEEMEIGYPTDVRHVSHIGWDSSSSSAPSWLHEFKTSNTVLEPNSSWPFQDLKSAMEAFGEAESSKELGRESTKQNLKKKLSSKASLLCNPWSPRFSRSSKVLA
ncbi:hypothetical protein EUTSA_v10023756mg [Eutrema salsugineum]|uniref:CRIB domain-containing protein n=1 Tax=Eutrema salsugineum TaxID=72664 RepID=V4KPF7_EUTSA|nr:CRIB domain-containing protein RIC9 [Eutrema salsugineum]ESQ29248.1 hypothetical protein EUTSA_v10023756mg [Eutrema salsugineum]